MAPKKSSNVKDLRSIYKKNGSRGHFNFHFDLVSFANGGEGRRCDVVGVWGGEILNVITFRLTKIFHLKNIIHRVAYEIN